MIDPHPLDQAVLSSLLGRHARFARGRDGAVRYDPAYAAFVALTDRSGSGLAGLAALAAGGELAFMERDPPGSAPGLIVTSEIVGVQMVAGRPTNPPPLPVRPERLGDADAPEMLALALLTEPGPFFHRTHRLGDFVGVKRDGRLVAMAGERLKPDGFTEISAVCTHPDYRGNGYAAALTTLVAARIRKRGETPFLHTYADNTAAISLYERLGFSLRCQVQVTRLTLEG